MMPMPNDANARLLSVLNRNHGLPVHPFAGRDDYDEMLGLSRRINASHLVVGTLYWTAVIVGCLTALNVFGTRVTDGIVLASASLLPRVVGAFAIVVTGIWLAQYARNAVLVWGHEEGIPSPRNWSAAVKALVILLAVVIASDVLDFAEHVFLATFVIATGGIVLAVSLAVGLGSRKAVEDYLSRRREHLNKEENASVWQHL
jgi:hypothetical protein